MTDCGVFDLKWGICILSLGTLLPVLRGNHDRGVIRLYAPKVEEDGSRKCLLDIAGPKAPINPQLVWLYTGKAQDQANQNSFKERERES